ncbi:MAG TPA: hypothetical protein VMV27_16660 [Candidatus Binataceae bacterium]|nr:hypothetical protein [Candidatus Binataceae bacterium]
MIRISAASVARVIGALAITAMIVLASGCAESAIRSPIAAAAAASDPTFQVFQHCRELVCTQADIPRCDFSEVVESGGTNLEREEFHCARSGQGTLCEERRQLIGAEDQTLEAQVLKFGCSGDPVRCQMLGGDAPWGAALEHRESNRQALTCGGPRPAGPPPAPHPVPGPDTV